MERRKVITSFCAFFGLGGSLASAAPSKPVISKDSTRCQISEYLQSAGAATRGPNSAPTQTPASRPESPR
jgi:hypothetical protein